MTSPQVRRSGPTTTATPPTCFREHASGRFKKRERAAGCRSAPPSDRSSTPRAGPPPLSDAGPGSSSSFRCCSSWYSPSRVSYGGSSRRPLRPRSTRTPSRSLRSREESPAPDSALAALLAAAADAAVPGVTTWGALVDALGSHEAPASFAHPGGAVINAAAAGGGRILPGGAHGRTRQLTLPSAAVARTYDGHAGAVTALAVQGPTLVSGDVRGIVLVHDLPSGRQLAQLDAGSQVKAVAMDPAHRVAAAVDQGGGLHRWLLGAGSVVPLAVAHLNAVDVVGTSDGRFAVATTEGGLLAMSAAADSPPRRLAPAHTALDDHDPQLAARPDGSVVARSDDGFVVVPSKGSPRAFPAAQESALALSDNGASVLVGTKLGTLRRWTLSAAGASGGDTYTGNSSPVSDLVMQGSWAAALTETGGIVVWDLDRASAPGADPVVPGDSPVAVAYAPSGQLAVGFSSGRLSVFGASPGVGTEVAHVDLGPAATPIAIGWRGQQVVAGTTLGEVVRWLPSAHSTEVMLAGHSPLTAMSLSRDGNIAVGRQDGSVQVVSGGSTNPCARQAHVP